MDGPRFDQLLRRAMTASSRRFMLRALGGGALAAALGRFEPAAAATCNRKGDRCGAGEGACCKDLKCCRNAAGAGRCRSLGNDPINCGACGARCPAGAACLHGTCTCDPFANLCPDEVNGQCTCGAVRAGEDFIAACVSRNSACDLDRPCEVNADCPLGSVCLLGCSDPPDPQPKRCSNPCIPV
jgi:hypothetical protein